MVYVLKAWWCSMAMLNQMVTLQKLWKPNHRTSSSPTKNWNCPHLSGVCFHSYRTSNCTSGRKYQFIKCPISCMATSARRRKGCHVGNIKKCLKKSQEYQLITQSFLQARCSNTKGFPSCFRASCNWHADGPNMGVSVDPQEAWDW